MGLRSVKRAGSLNLVPPIGHVRLAQIVVIPILTVATREATVLNSFVFRQTDEVPGEAVRELTMPLDFNQQYLAWKREVCPRHWCYLNLAACFIQCPPGATRCRRIPDASGQCRRDLPDGPARRRLPGRRNVR